LPIGLRVRCYSQVTDFLGKTVEFLTQEGKTSLFDQGHLPAAAADVA
jgi:hypothetical protein